MTKSSNGSSNDFMSTPFWSNSVNDIQNFLQRLSGNIDSLSSSRRQLLEQSCCNGLGNAFPTDATLPLGATFVIVTGWLESAE